MGRWIIHIAFCLGISMYSTQAQNLVPNPGFEEFYQCPPYPGQILEAKHWDSPNNTTSDFFHRCADVSTGAGIPENLFGIQEAASGNGYAGIRTWIPSTSENTIYREYLSTQLAQPLQKGEYYKVSFQISVAEEATHISDDIGVYLSPQPFSQERIYPVSPVIENQEGNLLTNTNSWETIQGTYLAKGGEAYLMLGNFLDDATMTLQPGEQTSGQSEMVYYYIDNIEVSPCRTPPTPLSLGPDTLLCAEETLLIRLDTVWENIVWQNGSSTTEFLIEEAGEYIATTTFEGCNFSDTLIVTKPSFSGISLKDTSICPAETLQIQLPLEENAVLEWQDGSTSNPYLITNAGFYSLMIQENNCSLSDSFNVSMESPTFESVIEIDTFFCKGESLEFQLPESEGYYWGDGFPDEKRKIIQARAYLAISPGRCYDREIRLTVVEDVCSCDVFIPNVFTPNFDGMHDTFKLNSQQPLETFQLTIVSRWGEEVFFSENIQSAWDGKMNNSLLPDGVYFWHLRYSCASSSQEFHRMGSLTLIR